MIWKAKYSYNKSTLSFMNDKLTANIWIFKVQPTLLSLQKHVEAYSSGLRLMVDESGWDASWQVRFITTKSQFQKNLLRIIVPKTA